MLEISGKTNLLEQNAYKYSLQDVAEPNLQRDIYTQGMVPKVPFNHRRVPMSGDDAVAGSFQRLHDREHGSYAYTTSGTDHSTEVVNVRSLSQRADNIRNIIAFVQFAKTGRGEPDFLNHQCDGSLYRVGFRNGKRHTFAFFAHTYNDKVPCLT